MSARSKQDLEIKTDSNEGFGCETHVFEDTKMVHWLHNPKTGDWKKSEVCKK